MWTPKAEAEEEIERDLSGIVGFEIPIARLEGKLKLNQNRSREDRQGVVAALSRSTDAGEREIAAMIADQLADEPLP